MTKAELDSIKILPLEDSWYRKVKEKLDGIAKPLDGLGKFEHLIAQIGAKRRRPKYPFRKKQFLLCVQTMAWWKSRSARVEKK